MFLAVSLSLLVVLPGPEKFENVISTFDDMDFDSKRFAAQVHDLNECRAMSCSIVQHLEKSRRAQAHFGF